MKSMTAMYCPECGNEAMVPESVRWPYECPYCGEEMRYLRLPGIVLRRRTKKAAHDGNRGTAQRK